MMIVERGCRKLSIAEHWLCRRSYRRPWRSRLFRREMPKGDRNISKRPHLVLMTLSRIIISRKSLREERWFACDEYCLAWPCDLNKAIDELQDCQPPLKMTAWAASVDNSMPNIMLGIYSKKIIIRLLVEIADKYILPREMFRMKQPKYPPVLKLQIISFINVHLAIYYKDIEALVYGDCRCFTMKLSNIEKRPPGEKHESKVFTCSSKNDEPPLKYMNGRKRSWFICEMAA